MTTQHRSPEPAVRRHFPRWRPFTWVILAFNVVMLAWIISAIASHASTCHGLTGTALTDCEASNTGVGIAATLLFIFWALGDVILGVLWLITRPRTRTCPVCGNGVKRGVTWCPHCGFDFARQFEGQSLQSPDPHGDRQQSSQGWGQGAGQAQPPRQNTPDWRQRR